LSPDPDLARTIAFSRWVSERTSTSAEPTVHGVAFRRDDTPLRYDSNFLWVDDAAGAAAEELAAEADASFSHVMHREIFIPDAAEGARLAPGFKALGFNAIGLVVMAHRREPDRPPDAGVEEVSIDDLRRADREFIRRGLENADDEVVEQLWNFRLILPETVGARFVVARVGGEIVSASDVYVDGRIAMVDNVATFEEHRGKGLARAVVSRSVGVARAAGSDLVFLHADLDDWPQHLYVKLGFDPIGEAWSFLKEPARAAFAAELERDTGQAPSGP
jgi:ribosomal protein S18 acetylase RimI-like enzyme